MAAAASTDADAVR